MNECEPKFNIFVCCGCRIKVIYPLNTSDKIKCSRCRAVNLVPTSVRPLNSSNYGYQGRGGQQGRNTQSSNLNQQQYNNQYNNPYTNNLYNNSQYANNPYNQPQSYQPYNQPYNQPNSQSNNPYNSVQPQNYPPPYNGFSNSGYNPPGADKKPAPQ